MINVIFAATALLAGQESSKLMTDKGPLIVRPVEHATMVLEWTGQTIYVDPVRGADRFKRFAEPNLILITDVHGDHCDPKTVLAIRTDKTVIVAPAAVAGKFPEAGREFVSVLANGKSMKWGDASIEAVPMYNLTPERKKFHVKGRGNGYVLKLGGKRIYVSGDTEDVPEMRALKDIDAAFVCMNLPYTMDVAHAADAVLAFKPKVVFPYHYRGKGMISDVKDFRKRVSKDPSIEVRLLEWYPK